MIFRAYRNVLRQRERKRERERERGGWSGRESIVSNFSTDSKWRRQL